MRRFEDLNIIIFRPYFFKNVTREAKKNSNALYAIRYANLKMS
jgi:hypothetical protein